MNLRKYSVLGSFAGMAFIGLELVPQRAAAVEVVASQEVEVLTRGPVHEAFAGTVSYDPQQGILVSVKPPEAIEEVPPDHQLEGENVVWIPGYWAWDEDQNDFLWVSGIWRNLPPGRQWVPGYWSEAEGGYQWTSGYWADTENSEVSYLPEPPRSVEAGPNIEAPSENHTWVSGNWIWRENRYAWRGGYWAECRPDWVWAPSCYRWTRRGYVYVDGYWDYSVARRGVLFAPVRFGGGVYSRAGFCYSPSTVISVSVFTDHLFLRPNYGHYYFGDYYAPRYRDAGYYASFSYHSGRRGCDPIYAYQAWEHRGDRNWQQSRRHDFEYRRDHEDARPPRTWAVAASRGENFEMAQRLDRVVGNRGNGNQHFKAVERSAREGFAAQRQEVRKFSQERQRLEARRDRPAAAMVADREKTHRSPIAAKSSARAERGDVPPKRLEGGKVGNQNQPRAATAGKAPDFASRPDRQPLPQINRKADSLARGKANSNAQTEPQAGRKIQPNTGRPAISPRGQSKPATSAPRSSRQAETAAPRQSRQRQAAPAPMVRKSPPDAKRQAVSPPSPKARAEQNRQISPRQNRETSPTVKRRAAQPHRQQTEPRRAAPAPTQRVAPKPSRQTQPQQQSTRRAAPAQPQGQQVQRPHAQKAPQSVRPERPHAKQNQAIPAPRSGARNKQEEERRNKNRQII